LIVTTKFSNFVGSDALNRRLLQLGLVKDQNGKFVPKGYGILLCPGAPPSPITLPQMKSFKAPVLSGNPHCTAESVAVTPGRRPGQFFLGYNTGRIRLANLTLDRKPESIV